jgi:ankyrin repeat protein
MKHVIDMRWSKGVHWFLDQGADPNAVHPEALETSLHWAVKRGASLEVIQALLDAGADPNARTKAGRSAYLGIKGATPLDYALRLGSTSTAALLRGHGAVASETTPLDQFVYAAAAGDRPAVSSLSTNRGSSLDALDVADLHLIAHVAQMQNWSGVKLMIELGWPIDAAGWMEARPLTWALCFGAADMVDFLLNRGASLSPTGGYFQNPLHTVVHCRWEKGDHASCLRRLLQEPVKVPEDFYPCGNMELDEVLAEFCA